LKRFFLSLPFFYFNRRRLLFLFVPSLGSLLLRTNNNDDDALPSIGTGVICTSDLFCGS